MAIPVQRTGSDNDRIIRYVQDTYGYLHRSQGQLFYVDSGVGTGGDDTDNPGTNPYAPLLTVTRALALCTSGQGDIIQIISNSPSSPPASETFPIAVNKANVTIRGCLGYPGVLLSDSGIGADDDNPCIEIGANFVSLEDMYFGIRAAGHAGGVIDFNGTNSYYGCAIRRCTIETQYTAGYGIDLPTDQPYLLIEDCKFGRISATNFTDCIRVGNCTDGVFRRNLFFGFSGLGINTMTGNCGNLAILDNRFVLPSDTEGKAITLNANCTDVYVDGNHASYGDVTMTANPYKDEAAADTNHWGLNYKGITATDPA